MDQDTDEKMTEGQASEMCGIAIGAMIALLERHGISKNQICDEFEAVFENSIKADSEYLRMLIAAFTKTIRASELKN